MRRNCAKEIAKTERKKSDLDLESSIFQDRQRNCL